MIERVTWGKADLVHNRYSQLVAPRLPEPFAFSPPEERERERARERERERAPKKEERPARAVQEHPFGEMLRWKQENVYHES